MEATGKGSIKKKSMVREIVELVIIFLVMLFVFRFLLMSVRVNGTSMNPNYNNGDRGVMVRTNPINNPKRFNVIVVKYKESGTGEELIVKRVFGLPNDTVEIKDNKVYVNDKVVDDKYRASDTDMDNLSKVTLADDEYFILGDNRQVSLDSRSIGPVKRNSIEAINGIVYWPLGAVGLMN